LMDLVLATRNQDKVREIVEILGKRRFRILSLSDFPQFPPVVEDGKTLEENAHRKARSCFEHTKKACLADDTGLEVEALGGRPGLYSSRYAGVGATYTDNVRKLLREMEDVPEQKRGAVFRCVVVIVDSEGAVHKGEGSLQGNIRGEPTGVDGFGYDPVFYVSSIGKTLAQLTLAEKNRISHRSIAVRSAIDSWIGA
jgi:XTP/dITP diphosphohydrolase